MPEADLAKDPMMKHLMESLNEGKSIEEYGRLVFTMTSRHFLDKDEVVNWLSKDPEIDEKQAAGLLEQVNSRNYNPPSRNRVMEWMNKQGFPICDNPDDPDACNVYKYLDFPDEVYEHINQYREQKSSK